MLPRHPGPVGPATEPSAFAGWACRARVPGVARAAGAAGTAILLALLVACGSGSPGTATEPASAVVPRPGTAAALLETLPMKGRAPRTGYDRALYGQAWADTDRNGCDTRNDVLRRDLDDVVLDERTHGCVVLSGTLAEPYTGTTSPFVRGSTGSTLHVDHVVALSDAWQKGAQGWSPARRLAFANDPLNLLAVDAAQNLAKGDGDAATWLPPAAGYRCAYVARQVAVKTAYGAWVTAAERDAIRRVLRSCPDEVAPVGQAPVEADVGSSRPSVPPGTGATVRPTAAAGSCEAAYPDFCIPRSDLVGDLDCGDVARGSFTVLAPDPHRFDADGDGLGCRSG